MILANEHAPALRCSLCGEEHAAACDALRVAGEAGARPIGVPVRVQAAYVEARQALRANAPAVAIRVLQWLLSHLAEIHGANPELTLFAKLAALSDAGILSKTIRRDVIERARAGTPTHEAPETAWALMTLAEHALGRAYLRRGGA